MRLFLFVVSHTRQKQNYKNYTSAVYCRNNGKAEPAPLLSNTRNIYMSDFRGFNSNILCLLFHIPYVITMIL